MNQLKQIQAQIFRGGFHQSIDTLKKLMVFCADPSNGNLVHAERVFNYIQNPGLFVYNIMIKAFAKKGDWVLRRGFRSWKATWICDENRAWIRFLCV
ncbi:hypothetical protein OIU84_004401 [Salix udensis]|uniref:Pentatricopeptide repeat-containing protein n=1 Tax=Salix udensis TaxID=889485 RepID=A0AAD6K475_9ROSI|nr:hypothetical protein OIU84_004401 [Salix udensis]